MVLDDTEQHISRSENTGTQLRLPTLDAAVR